MAGQTLTGVGGAGPVSSLTLDTRLSILGEAVTNQLITRFAVSEVLSRSSARPTLDTAGEVRRDPIILQGSAPVSEEAVAGMEPGENSTNIYWCSVTGQDPLLSDHLAGYQDTQQ